jgi:hypothetical protein
MKRIPEQLEYLRLLEMDTAYITPQMPDEPVTKYRRRVYDVFLQIVQAETLTIGMLIERMWPDTD